MSRRQAAKKSVVYKGFVQIAKSPKEIGQRSAMIRNHSSLLEREDASRYRERGGNNDGGGDANPVGIRKTN